MDASEEAAASEARSRLLVEQSPLVVYTHDGSRPPAMTYVSPQVEYMLGIEPARWLEQPFLWVTRIHPDDREDVLARIDEACLEDRRFTLEYRYRTQEDHDVWVRDEATPVRDDDGRVVYWQGALSDISDRKATEEAFKQSEVGEREKAYAAGFDGYFSKPITPETFMDQLEAFLGGDDRRGAP